MQVHIYPQHGREKPIGTAFISYARKDETAVENLVLEPLSRAGLPYSIDTQDIGSAKTMDAIKGLLEDCSCGIIALSNNSIKSPWVWYEAGMLEGLGKRLIPFSLSSDEAKKQLVDNVPDFVRLYNILDKTTDLVDAVSEQTLVAGHLRRNPHFNQDTYSELKSNDIEIVFSGMPAALIGRLEFGLLLVKFGTKEGLEQAHTELAQRDGFILN